MREVLWYLCCVISLVVLFGVVNAVVVALFFWCLESLVG